MISSDYIVQLKQIQEIMKIISKDTTEQLKKTEDAPEVEFLENVLTTINGFKCRFGQHLSIIKTITAPETFVCNPETGITYPDCIFDNKDVVCDMKDENGNDIKSKIECKCWKKFKDII